MESTFRNKLLKWIEGEMKAHSFEECFNKDTWNGTIFSTLKVVKEQILLYETNPEQSIDKNNSSEVIMGRNSSIVKEGWVDSLKEESVTEKDFENIIAEEIKNGNGFNAYIKCFSLAQQMCETKENEIAKLKSDIEWHNEEILRLGGVIGEREQRILDWIEEEKNRPKNIPDVSTAFNRLVKFIDQLNTSKFKSKLSKSIEDCKDKIAQKEGYGDWSDLINSITEGVVKMNKIAKLFRVENEAMQLYKNS